VRTIGLLGGMSWESSVEYERLINAEVRTRLGGTHSADLLIRSYDFAEIEALQSSGDWAAAGDLLAADASRLEVAGADLIVLCTNTMHRLADRIETAITVPFLHIGDVTADAVAAQGLGRVGLLGTRFTMAPGFYRQALAARGVEVVVPDETDQDTVHAVIYDELVRGVIREESRQAYLDVTRRLRGAGAAGIIAGCTEIELLIGPDDVEMPFFPTTRLHALAAVDAALGA
jgi:aspartate racemase